MSVNKLTNDGVPMNIVFFLIGLLVGSFLNVCIYRIPRKESIVWPRSHCPQCNYLLQWYELIPVASYLLLRGKCRRCRCHISMRYPVIELLAGLVFTLAYAKFGLGMALVKYLIFICLLITIAMIDQEHFIIPNILVAPGVVLGLVSTALPGMPSLENTAGAGLGAGLLFWIIWRFYPKGMGEGDIKYALMLGFVLGWPAISVAVFLAALIGTVFGIIGIVAQGGDRNTPIPFGLYLSLGSFVALIYGQQIFRAYLRVMGLHL